MTKKKLLAPLFLAASFLIVGCSASEIVGRPSWIDDPIVVNPGDEKYKDNTLKEIYDAIKKLGDTNANVLNKVMYDIAKQHIGSYEDVINEETKEITEVGLRTIVSGQATEEQFKAFVEKHQIYKADEFGFTRNEETVSEKTNLNEQQKHDNSLAKITEQFNRINEDICKKLFDEIKGGSYSTKIDKYFEESYFIEHLYKEMYYEGDIPTEGVFTEIVFFPKKESESWVDYVDGHYLHVFKDDGTFEDYYKGYIERKILPEIYRTLLIENYVREQRETNLGRSYARKINLITIPRPSSSDVRTDNNIKQMLINYAKDNLIGATPDTNFEVIKDAMVGFASITGQTGTESMQKSFTLLDNKFERLKVDGKDFVWGIRTDEKTGHLDEDGTLYSTYVYRGTKLFDIVDKYIKINNVEYVGKGSEPASYEDFAFHPKEHLTSDEQSAYDDLTNKGAYTVEKGLEIKEREIRLTDMTQDGWFLKSSGVSGLGQEFGDKLFNITTARIIDNREAMQKEKPDQNDTVRYFGANIKDKKAFVYKDKSTTVDPEADSIILSDDTNYYILEVKEAVSASKLSLDEGEYSYLGLKATAKLGESNDKMNDIVSKITEQVANSDTFKKNAEQYYLMISNIVFYDQSVYDYFKSQFPDLFK